ncbi:MAG: hypothetical protein ACI4LX_09780 [Treponema sp.]
MNKLSDKKKNGFTSVFSISLLPSPPVYVQLVLGFFCAILDHVLCTIAVYKDIHLFLDMCFTIFAAYFGLVAGLFSSVLKHVAISLLIGNHIAYSVWGICTVTAVLAVRLFLAKQKSIFILELLSLVLILTCTISIEGAIIASFFYNFSTTFIEAPTITGYILSLLRQGFPLLFSAFLSRIPVNFIDKGIAVLSSWILYCTVRVIMYIAKKDKSSKPS